MLNVKPFNIDRDVPVPNAIWVAPRPDVIRIQNARKPNQDPQVRQSVLPIQTAITNWLANWILENVSILANVKGWNAKMIKSAKSTITNQPACARKVSWSMKEERYLVPQKKLNAPTTLNVQTIELALTDYAKTLAPPDLNHLVLLIKVVTSSNINPPASAWRIAAPRFRFACEIVAATQIRLAGRSDAKTPATPPIVRKTLHAELKTINQFASIVHQDINKTLNTDASKVKITPRVRERSTYILQSVINLSILCYVCAFHPKKTWIENMHPSIKKYINQGHCHFIYFHRWLLGSFFFWSIRIYVSINLLLPFPALF